MTLLFIDLKGTNVEELRDAAQKADVHLYTREACNVWASGPYVVLHGANDGEIHFTAQTGNVIYDEITGEVLTDSKQLTFPIKKGETRVFRCCP